jgi:L-amino acid N-acyltransferase YncA
MATEDDVDAIMDIYRPYILETAITFEYEEVSKEAFLERMRTYRSNFRGWSANRRVRSSVMPIAPSLKRELPLAGIVSALSTSIRKLTVRE